MNVIKRKTDTVERIETALCTLLQSETLSEIKMREICSLASIHHQAFYNHLFDQFDLYKEMENKGIQEALTILSSGFSVNASNNRKEYLDQIAETKYFFRLFQQKDTSQFKEALLNSISPILEKEMKIMSREKYRRYLTLYILCGSISILEAWIKQGRKEPSD